MCIRDSHITDTAQGVLNHRDDLVKTRSLDRGRGPSRKNQPRPVRIDFGRALVNEASVKLASGRVRDGKIERLRRQARGKLAEPAPKDINDVIVTEQFHPARGVNHDDNSLRCHRHGPQTQDQPVSYPPLDVYT